MFSKLLRHSWPLAVSAVLGIGLLTHESALSGGQATSTQAELAALRPTSLVQKGDRLAWIGSSSTKIGIWPKTVEFLLRTRHPELGVTFQSHSTGGGTFKTALEHLDGWLDESQPSLVVFNFGGNDAAAGVQGLEAFQERMLECVAKARYRGARTVLVTPQAADTRKSGRDAAAKRALFAEAMLDFGRERGLTVIDVHEPLEALQRHGQRHDPEYTILKDRIHLTDSAYVGWGFFFYDRLDLPRARSAAIIHAGGKVISTVGCEIRDVHAEDGLIRFTRSDRVLPILPPGPLPPRDMVPLETLSPYRLRVVGLKPGRYEVACDGKPLGVADHEMLALGLNLNSLLLDSGNEAPWASLARAVWDGRDLDEVGRKPFEYELRRLDGPATPSESDPKSETGPEPDPA